MNKTIMLLLALCSLSFAQFDELLDSHYQASQNEDWNAYIATFDTSEMSPQDIQNMRDVVETVWKNFDTDSYQVSELTYILDGEGYALVRYVLQMEISGAESTSIDTEYIVLCRLSGSSWKLLYNMPLLDYLEFTDDVQDFVAAERAAEIFYNKTSYEPGGDGVALLDGSPAKYTPDTEAEEGFCETDYDCQVNNWGNECVEGVCIHVQQPPPPPPPPGVGGCGTAYILLISLCALFMSKK